jgi:oligopeptide transport system ATP-binding protein
MRLQHATSGEVLFNGQDVNKLKGKQLKDYRRRVQYVFQDPYASLNPRMTINELISEPLVIHGLMKDRSERDAHVRKLLSMVGLNPEHANRYPHEFSGGQRQRIGIARALIMQPEFVVADEPISALDVSIRAQVLNLLNNLKASRGLTYLFIAHDLSVVRFISDRIAVISKGRIVELAEAEELFQHPLHPYTKALLSAVPIPDPELEKKKKLLVYDPSIHDYSVDQPVWHEIANGHFVYGNQKELEAYHKEYEQQSR